MPAEPRRIIDYERLTDDLVRAFRSWERKPSLHRLIVLRAIVNALIDGSGSPRWEAECEEFGCHDDDDGPGFPCDHPGPHQGPYCRRCGRQLQPAP